MTTTQARLRYGKIPYEEGTLAFQYDYVRKMCYIVANRLGLPDDALVIEEVYTKFILQILEGKREKTSIKSLTFEFINSLTRKPSYYFGDLPEYYEPVAEAPSGAANNPYTLIICNKLKELRGEENYENALQYYSTVRKNWGNNQHTPYGRDPEKERKEAVIRSRTTKLRLKLKKNAALRSFFEKKLELANNYDFIY